MRFQASLLAEDRKATTYAKSIRYPLEKVLALPMTPGFQKTDAVCDLLKPYNADLMRRFEVSNRVNLVKNDDPACAEPVSRGNVANAMAVTE
jgi:hypothetical protein